MRSGLLVLAVLLSSSSCGALRFDVTQPIPSQEVPGASWASFLTGLLPGPLRLSIDVETETEKQGTGPATSAGLHALRLRAVSGNPVNFDFLDSVVVSVSADGLPTREVARLSPVLRARSASASTSRLASSCCPTSRARRCRPASRVRCHPAPSPSMARSSLRSAFERR